MRGREKSSSTARPLRSSTESPVKPRSTDARLTAKPFTSSAPASTPVRRPRASCVGTAITTTCLRLPRAASPSLTNGASVAITCLT